MHGAVHKSCAFGITSKLVWLVDDWPYGNYYDSEYFINSKGHSKSIEIIYLMAL